MISLSKRVMRCAQYQQSYFNPILLGFDEFLLVSSYCLHRKWIQTLETYNHGGKLGSACHIIDEAPIKWFSKQHTISLITQRPVYLIEDRGSPRLNINVFWLDRDDRIKRFAIV